jgi:hypothetical protein
MRNQKREMKTQQDIKGGGGMHDGRAGI